MIALTKEPGDGDPTPNDNTIKNMLNGDELILINNNDQENPVYRALVQTPGPLHYKGIGTINYKEEAIKEGISTLIGHDVIDEANIHERKLGLTGKPFATIVNADYCPKYGAYADIEIYNDDYKPVFENMLKHRETSKRKFSTELSPLQMDKVGNGIFDLNKLKYDGLTMTVNPRDKSTGLCDVIVNSKDFKEDETVTDELQAKYDKLQVDYTELQNKYSKGEKAYQKGLKLYKEGKQLYKEAKEEIEDLTGQLKPFWEEEEKTKLELVNSLAEKYPEKEQDAAKTRFEKMELEDLKLINSVGPSGTPAPGAVGNGGRPDKTELTDEDLDELMKQAGKA